jgi:LacI family transcriptional regulator
MLAYKKRKKITLKDIALKTGFTVNTVARALRDKEEISEQTRSLIQATARQMGYVSNSLAGSLRSGVTRTIAVILGDISNPNFAILVKEIEEAAREQEYGLFVINTDEEYKREEQAVCSAISKNVDGIILIPTQERDEDIRLLRTNHVPFVLVGRRFERDDVDYVICDDARGGYLATRHLIDKGHRRILLLDGPQHISSARERKAGYLLALQESGIQPRDELIREVSVVSGDCSKRIRQLVDEGIEYTGIFAFSDLIAFEAIYTLQEMGRRVPEDVSVVGFDNIQSKIMIPFPLTTVDASKREMAQRAFSILFNKMKYGEDDRTHHEVVETHLVIGRSS